MASIKSVASAVGSTTKSASCKVGSTVKDATLAIVRHDFHAPKLRKSRKNENRDARVAASKQTAQA